jgi:hypothetical protein
VTGIAQALGRFRREPTPPEGRTRNPFKLMSTVGEPASADEVRGGWGPSELPTDVLELWTSSREARLFEDIEYG